MILILGVTASGKGKLAFDLAKSLGAEIIRNYHELALICIEKDNREEAVRLMKIALEKPALIASGRDAFVTPGTAIVGHGGVSIEEVIVPLIKFERGL